MSAGNDVSAAGFAKWRGDPMDAFDNLPQQLRQALAEAIVQWDPFHEAGRFKRLERLVGYERAIIIQVTELRVADAEEIAEFSRAREKAHGRPTPHVAAGVTIQRYGPPGGRVPRRRIGCRR